MLTINFEKTGANQWSYKVIDSRRRGKRRHAGHARSISLAQAGRLTFDRPAN